MANPNPKTEHLEATKWKPGQTGNPKGYSRKQRAIDHLMDLIEIEDLDELIARKWKEMILSGDFRYMKEYLDRRDGKVKDIVEIENKPAPVIVELPAKEPLPLAEPEKEPEA